MYARHQWQPQSGSDQAATPFSETLRNTRHPGSGSTTVTPSSSHILQQHPPATPCDNPPHHAAEILPLRLFGNKKQMNMDLYNDFPTFHVKKVFKKIRIKTWCFHAIWGLCWYIFSTLLQQKPSMVTPATTMVLSKVKGLQQEKWFWSKMPSAHFFFLFNHDQRCGFELLIKGWAVMRSDPC